MGSKQNSEKRIDRRASAVLTDHLLVDTIHKLKNGLGGIEGFATLLQRDIAPDSPGQKMALKVQEGVRKVNDLVTLLMFVVRDIDIHADQFRLTLLIRQMLPGLQSVSGENTAQLIVHPETGAEDSSIKADPQLVERMVEYVDRFLASIRATLVCIELSGGRPGNVRFTFLYLAESGDQAESVTDYMKQLHAPEPRLALVAIEKIVDCHGGTLNISMLSGRNKYVQIELPKGFQ
ncbi:hypothetical protein JXO52_08545 [bacterium]|nr:hypothetical protein [bacterium]